MCVWAGSRPLAPPRAMLDLLWSSLGLVLIFDEQVYAASDGEPSAASVVQTSWTKTVTCVVSALPLFAKLVETLEGTYLLSTHVVALIGIEYREVLSAAQSNSPPLPQLTWVLLGGG